MQVLGRKSDKPQLLKNLWECLNLRFDEAVDRGANWSVEGRKAPIFSGERYVHAWKMKKSLETKMKYENYESVRSVDERRLCNGSSG